MRRAVVGGVVVVLWLLCLHADSPREGPAPPAADAVSRIAPAQYAGMVSVAMEAMRQFLGPRTEEENRRFDAIWAPLFHFPCPEVIAYLERLTPLLEEFFGRRTEAAALQARMEEAWTAVIQAGYCGDVAHSTLCADEARLLAGELRRVLARMTALEEAIRALGDPPDPLAAKARARRRSDDALAYTQKALADPDLRQIQSTTTIKITVSGKFVEQTTGRGKIIREPQIWNLAYDAKTIRAQAKYYRSNFKVGMPPSPIDPDDRSGYFLPDEAWSESKPNEAADLFMAIEAKSIPITWNGLEFSGSITSAWRGEGRIGDLKGVSQRTVRGKISKDARTIEELVVAERSLGTDGSDVGVTVIGVRLNGLSRFDTRAFTFSDGKWRKELLFSRWLRGLNSGADLDAAMPEFVWFRHSAWELAGRPMTRTEILKPESLESFQVTLMEFPPAMRVEQASERDKEGWRDSEISRVEMLAWLADGQDWQDGRGDPVAAVGRIQPVRPGQAAPSAAGTEGEAEADDTVQRIREHEANIQAVSRYLERLEADLAAERGKQPPDAGRVDQIRFLISCQQSEIQSEKDLIESIRTGRIVHTRTPFDEVCSREFRRKCETEARNADAVARERRNVALLAERAGIQAQNTAFNEIQSIYAAGAGTDLARWRALRQRLQHGLQAQLEAESRSADAKTEEWENRVWAAEWVKTGADTAFGVVASAGGFTVAKLAYSGVTSAVEKGLEQYLNTESPKEGLKHAVFYGFKGVITDYSDSADYVWTGVDAYRETPGSETDKAAAVAQALGTKYAIKWGTNKASEYLSGWLVQKGKPPGWTTSDSMEYARWKQQQEWDQALVKDWEDTYKACRRAELTRAPAADVDSLRQQLRAKSCAVNASYGAKVIMKHQVPPALSRGYAREMAAIHQEMVPELGQAMRGRGFAGPGGRDLEFQPIRNASSGDNVGVDHDLGLREQPDWIPDATGKLRRNVWLTRNGQPASTTEAMEDAQAEWAKIYRRRTGYDAKTSFENITTSRHKEAYVDRAWIRGDLDRVDPRWAQQAGDVTRVKAYEMMRDQPGLTYFQRVQEACRGTGKDIRTKLLPALQKIEADAGKTMTAADRQHHAEVTRYWTEVQDVMDRFGRGEIDPLELSRRIHLISGGRGVEDMVDRTGTMIESLGKELSKKKQ
mgnify:CR=1 FL=1